MRLFASGLLLTCVSFAGCSLMLGPMIEGSGNLTTETRSMGEFDHVGVAGAGEFVINVGDEHLASLTYDDNLMEHVITELDGSQLEIRQDGRLSSKHGLKGELVVEQLRGISIAGSGEVTVPYLHTDEFEIAIAGSGSIRANGYGDTLEIGIAGSGDVDLSELQVRKAVIEVAGSGDVKVFATEEVDIKIMGSGDVVVFGPAKISKTVMGSGDITQQEKTPTEVPVLTEPGPVTSPSDEIEVIEPSDSTEQETESADPVIEPAAPEGESN